jgi:dolichol-phosphate mannosyltransferase
MNLESIAVIIPMFNVEKHIQKVILEIPAAVKYIIAVDDQSKDQTVEMIKNLDDDRIILIQHEQNTGVGGAMVTGFRKAIEIGATIVVKVDGDGQMPMAFMDLLISPIVSGEADFTKGNRFAELDDLTRMPLKRRIGNLGLSFITKAASGYWNIFDPTNGFFAMDSLTLKRLPLKELHPRYFFESSLICALYRTGAVIRDVPIPAQYGDEKSSLSELKSFIEFPPLLFSRMIKRIWLRYFVMDFSIASLSLVFGILMMLFGCIWGGYWWYESMITNVPSTAGTVIIAALPLILGFELFLQFLTSDVQNIPILPKNKRGRNNIL